MNNQEVFNGENRNGNLSDFFAGIYRWMAMGVIISAIFAGITIYTNVFSFVFSSTVFYYGLIGIELLLVIGIQMIIRKVTPKVATGLFLLYSAINGITLSVIFYIYDIGTIIPIFIGAVVLYAILAFMGYNTKTNLSSWGSVLMPMTFAIVIMSLLNMIVFQSGMFHMIISAIVLLVFGALTIYDNQAYKIIYNNIQNNNEEIDRFTILGALHMYINFIAIFQSLLSLLGDR